MKKNALGHMNLPSETVGSKLRRWMVLPRLICVLLALVIWLAVTQFSPASGQKEEAKASAGVEETV